RPPSPPPFPYTTLFRSRGAAKRSAGRRALSVARRWARPLHVRCLAGGVTAARARPRTQLRRARRTGLPLGRDVSLADVLLRRRPDRKSTRLNSSHRTTS